MLDDHFHNGVKLGFDALSISVLLGTIADMLPAIAAVLTIVWTVIRIWETETVGRVVGRAKPPIALPAPKE